MLTRIVKLERRRLGASRGGFGVMDEHDRGRADAVDVQVPIGGGARQRGGVPPALSGRHARRPELLVRGVRRR